MTRRQSTDATPSPARRHRRNAAAVLLAVVVSVSGSLADAGPAQAASTIHCGDTVTTDTTLQADLTCPADGLLIGASGITLDLAGHRLTGSGSGFGITDGGRSARICPGTGTS